MNPFYEEILITLGLLPVGMALVYLCGLAGNVFQFLYQEEKNNPYQIGTRMLMGYLSVSSVFICIFLRFNTLYVLFLIFLAILLTRNRDKLVWNWKVPYLGLQLLIFGLFLLFRLSFLADWENESWKAMFKDDYFYSLNLSIIFYKKRELSLYFNILKDLNLENKYHLYHFFSFYIGIIAKFLTRFPSYFIYNFTVLPFFQLFAFNGLFSVCIFLKSKPLKSALISLFVMSSLRYTCLDEFIFETLQTELFSRSVLLQNYFGFQLLNSGFGLKFCVGLGLASIFLSNLDNMKILLGTAFILYINPLFILVFSYISSFILFFKKNEIKKYGFLSFFLIGTLFLFLKIKNKDGDNISFNDLFYNISSVVNTGLKKIFFIALGELFNSFYNIWLIPALLILIYEGKIYRKILSLFFILFPIYDIYYKNNITSKIYLAFVFFLNIFLITKNFKNKYFFFLYIVPISCLFISIFSQLYPEINQVFMFVLYSFPFLSSLYIINKYFKFFNFYIYLLSFLTILNFYLNYKENMIRSVNLSIRNESQSINQFLNKFKLDKINYIGIYDRKMTFQFNNQFLEGEELFIQNDHFIPTPASTPSLAPTHRKNSEFLRECFPIWKFSKKFNPVDTTTEFLKFYKIPILIVKNRDLKNAASATSLYSKSMVNTRLDYTVFYDLKNPKN